MRKVSSEERFWSFVNKTKTCWEWTGSLRLGYGCFRLNNKNVRAHRYSYLIAYGDPRELHVLHKCDNRKCVNPEHLFLGAGSDLERFWSFVDKTEGCWEWTGCLFRGYGQFGYNKKIVLAHRFSFSLVNGDPGELFVLHRCDNPKCIRLDHLFLGTTQDNVADAASKGRLAKGVQQPDAKLNDQLVVAIREWYSRGGTTQKALAKEYGVSQSVICKVVNRCAWKHIP